MIEGNGEGMLCRGSPTLSENDNIYMHKYVADIVLHFFKGTFFKINITLLLYI